jgi:Xaa-Pro aminopeptidase
MLRRAIAITVASVNQAMRSAKPGRWEYELEALIEGGFRRAGADGPAFGSIVGSGPNSTQYHYEKNDRRMVAGDVLVMDVGAAYRGYAADVTRTIPVSGRFSTEQRTIYQLVREAQAAAEGVAKPGASWQAWRDTARAVEARGLARLGLIESVDATFDPPWASACQVNPVSCTQAFLYMAHGLGHGIGLEVHDPPRPYAGSGTFQVGHVFTIEPGIYISTRLLDMLPGTPKNRAMIAKVRRTVERYQNIGVRIEDDYVITADGAEWLSRGPRELAEVESLRNLTRAAAAR